MIPKRLRFLGHFDNDLHREVLDSFMLQVARQLQLAGTLRRRLTYNPGEFEKTLSMEKLTEVRNLAERGVNVHYNKTTGPIEVSIYIRTGDDPQLGLITGGVVGLQIDAINTAESWVSALDFAEKFAAASSLPQGYAVAPAELKLSGVREGSMWGHSGRDLYVSSLTNPRVFDVFLAGGFALAYWVGEELTRELRRCGDPPKGVRLAVHDRGVWVEADRAFLYDPNVISEMNEWLAPIGAWANFSEVAGYWKRSFPSD